MTREISLSLAARYEREGVPPVLWPLDTLPTIARRRRASPGGRRTRLG
jgi:hypothetical protein